MPCDEPLDRVPDEDFRLQPVFEVLTMEQVAAQREYMHYERYTPAQRIHWLESIREQVHGPEALDAPVQRIFEIIEQP